MEDRFYPGKRVQLTTAGRQYEEDTGWYGGLTVAAVDETGVMVRNAENQARWMNRKGLETEPPPTCDSMEVPELPVGTKVRVLACNQLYGGKLGTLVQKGCNKPFSEGVRLDTFETNIWFRPDELEEEVEIEEVPELPAVDIARPVHALRYNEGKPPLHYLLTFGKALREIAKVCAYGFEKYKDKYNYAKGAPRSESTDSLLRHLECYWNGEDYDTESGCHHLAHVSWNALRLCQEALINAGTDDRGGYT